MKYINMKIYNMKTIIFTDNTLKKLLNLILNLNTVIKPVF